MNHNFLHSGGLSSLRFGPLLVAKTVVRTLFSQSSDPAATLKLHRINCSCIHNFSKTSELQSSKEPQPRQSVPAPVANQRVPAASPKGASERPSGFGQMLSRYRSVSILELPGLSNNPVQRFEEAVQLHRLSLQAERAGGGLIAVKGLRTALRLWEGPLEGIAHQAGQFTALEEGPAAEAVEPPPNNIAEALSQDLDFLMGLVELTRDVLYDAYGSESDFNVVPIILEPHLNVSLRLVTPGEPQPMLTVASATTSDPKQPSATQRVPNQATVLEQASDLLTSATLQPESASMVNDETGGGGGGWWSLDEAVTTPLSWEEVTASLGIAPELAARVLPPLRFNDQEGFLSHMFHKHVKKLEGGELLENMSAPLGSDLTTDERRTVRSAAVDKPVAAASAADTRSDPAAGKERGCDDATLLGLLGQEAMVGAQQQQMQQERQRRWPKREDLTAAEAMAAAVRELSDAVVFPAVLQVVVGSEAVGWNPIPVLWLGRSKRSGAILGLMTAVVWT